MVYNMNNAKSNNKIILILIGILILIVLVASLLNLNASKDKALLTANSEISIKMEDNTSLKVTAEDIGSLESETFTASLKSNGKDPVDVEYTGVPLATVLEEKEMSIAESQTVKLSSLDGYTVSLSGSEVLDKENVWLVWEKDGQPLDSNSGPYMVIIRKDSFSQRWSKQLCEITIAE